MYRYWSGTEWTPYLNINSAAPPPFQNPPYQAAYHPGTPYPGGSPVKKKSAKGWIIALGAVVVVVAVVIWFAIQPGSIIALPDPDPVPTEQTSYCPRPSELEPPEVPAIVGDRIYGGKMSFQELGSPWRAPHLDDRLAFADWGYTQDVVDQEFYTENSSWVASVLIAEVYSGDGFGGVKVGAEMILECAKGEFYGNTAVDQEDLVSQAYSVDGYPGWLIETKLHVSIPNLNASYDYVLFLLVETGDNQYSLYYASIPDTSEYLLPDARATMESLRVDG
jgi:hypothetical protein